MYYNMIWPISYVIDMVVGANDSINPRYFRVLESDGPVPTKLVRSAEPLSQLQLPALYCANR